MEKEYEDFVDEFQQKLREVTGYGNVKGVSPGFSGKKRFMNGKRI